MITRRPTRRWSRPSLAVAVDAVVAVVEARARRLNAWLYGPGCRRERRAPMTAAEAYATRFDAYWAQQARLFGKQPDAYTPEAASTFRFDPHRKLGPNLAFYASYVEPEDVVIDVGGGAGRVGLPLALRCREVINVEAAPAMGAEFEACAAEARITNVRLVQADWLEAEHLFGDVCLALGVLDWDPAMRELTPFVAKLAVAARRRVMINVITHAVPFTASDPSYVDLFRQLYGEEPELYPGYREVLPVLWEMGILPEVRVLPLTVGEDWGWGAQSMQRQEALDMVLGFLTPPWASEANRRGHEFQTRARGLAEAHLDQLFAETPEGLRPLASGHELLITWDSRQGRLQSRQ